MSYAPIDDILAKAIEVEKAAFRAYSGETTEYRAKMRSLFQNLKANRELAKRVFSGDIIPSDFVVMSSDELKSADLKKKEEALEKENMKKAQVPMVERSISDALECGKCKQKKVSYSQAQTRSADEPMTTFCECTVCGNRWKVCEPRTLDGCLASLAHVVWSTFYSRSPPVLVTGYSSTS
jgi:transcription elongation factor S-II